MAFCTRQTQIISRMASAGVLLVALFTATGCKSPWSDTDYFPLQEGMAWNYQVVYQLPEKRTDQSLTMTVLNNRPVYLAEGKVEHYPVRQSDQGTDYYIDARSDGYYRVARRLVVELKPQPDAKPRLILPKGKNLRKGYTWSEVGMPYTVQWKPPFTEMNASIKPFDFLYEIAELNATVETPAGTYENCVVVEGYGKMTIYADPRTGYKEVQVSHKEWYAPGVGLVKMERDESIDLDVIQGGKVTLLLSTPVD